MIAAPELKRKGKIVEEYQLYSSDIRNSNI